MTPRCPHILVAMLVAAPPGLSAQKVDTLTFRNGDRVTGEIKSLARGQLEYATSPMGTVSAKWTHVVRVESPRFFALTARSGARYYGALRAADDTGRVIIHVAQFADTVRLDSIVDMAPIGQGFLSRVDGYFDLGLTFVKANSNTQFSLGAEARYRPRDWLARVTVQSYYQSQASATATRRNSLTLFGERYLSGRFGLGGTAGLENNEELGLDLRGTLGAMAGLVLAQSTEAALTAYAGVNATVEDYADTPDQTTNLVGVLAVQEDVFRFGDHKLDVDAALQTLPSLTDWGRVRIEMDLRVAYELLRDLTVGLTVYDDFDSRPPGGSGAANDFGTTVTVGWKF